MGIREQLAFNSAAYHEWTSPEGGAWAVFFRVESYYLIRFPSLADFHVSADGKSVASWACPGVTEQTLRHLYLNLILPMALERQGKWVFHASAIDSPAGALVFVGESGRGKSTLAASFALAGHPFLTDDALVLEPWGQGYLVQPSHPSIRLWEDSRSTLVGENAELAPAVQYTDKARLLSGKALRFCLDARPLRCMYFLGNDDVDEVSIQPIAPSEALIALVRNSFVLDIESGASLSANFNRIVEILDSSTYFRLDYPRSFDALPLVRAAILEHASAYGASDGVGN